MIFATIVIPVFNNSHLTIKCIQNLLKYTPESAEIIVVDDGSDERDFNNLLRSFPQPTDYRKMNIVRLESNQGFATACNTGAEFSGRRNGILIFLNNDIIVLSDWFSPLISKLTEKTGLCGSKLLYPENKYSTIHHREITKGTIQHAGIIIRKDLIPIHAYQFEKSDLPEANICKTYPYVTGASISIKKEIFEEVGGFSKKYTNGCEDLDLCLKVRELNLDIAYCPESVAFHHETATRHPETNKNNLTLFIEKYKNKLENDITFMSKEPE